MTQKEMIIKYIRDFGSITHYEAVLDLGIAGFTARMTELRQQGIKFEQKCETSVNRYGKPVHYIRYSL